MTLEHAREKGISILDIVPDGWRKLEGATTAPEGYDWYSNIESRYGGNYKTALVRRRDMNEELREQAIAKLEAERETARSKHREPIIDYLIGRCRESESMAQDIMQEHKTWDKCNQYIQDMARNYLGGTFGCVMDETVYEWAEDYFHLDDKAAEEKKRQQKAAADERAKKLEEQRKKEAEEKKAKEEAEKAKRKEEAAAKRAEEKSKRKEVEGQMDLFSMFGESDG